MYYFNNNDNTNNNSSDNNNPNQQQHYNHNGPLFSQPLDPSTLNGVPTEFLNEHDHLQQHDYDNLILDYPVFDTSHNFDFYSQAQQQPLMDPQEAILLSDPNFLRQHQLLQDQQKEMHTRLIHDEDEERHGLVEQDPVMVSNLTTMFEPKQEVQVKIEQQEGEEDKKAKRNSHRRQQVVMKSNNEENEEKANTTTNKIDHQRRFNELQARFRVNYARKPTSTQQGGNNHVKSSHTINTTTATNTNFNTTTTISTTNNHTNNNKPSAKQQSTSPSTFPASFDDTAAAASPHEKPLSILTTTTPTVQINNTPTIASTPAVVIGGMVKNNEEFSGTNNSLSSSFPSRTMPIQIQRVPRHNSSQPFDVESHQKQLDSQLDKVDFNDITVSELKEMLRQRGKPATGKKAVLLQRLLEERDIAKGGRSTGSYGSFNGGGGRLLSNRHSQPLPFSRSVTGESPQRPRSFQGSSPVMIHNGSPNNNLTGSPSSPSAASFIPGSPSGSLHRSIANMHIGSPPAISRRYSPYSPRLSSSPKPTHHEYSSSVPLTLGDLSSSPTNNSNYMNNAAPTNNTSNNNMMLSSSYSARSSRIYNNPKTYKPFMSSALATPDREEDVNPFDSYYAGGGDPPIKEEEIPVEDHHHPSGSGLNNNNMDWIDPSSFDILLQQQVSHQQMTDMSGQQALAPQQVLTNEQIMALLNSQQQSNAFDFKLDDSNFNPEHHQPYYHHQ